MKKNTPLTTVTAPANTVDDHLEVLPDGQLHRVHGGGFRFQQVPPDDGTYPRVGTFPG